MKRRWYEASLHRQWGKQAAIAWTIGLCNFYRDRAGLRLGIGDISHVVGEAMTDHGSHQLGRDVDVYVLDYPSGSTFPEAYWCDGTTTTLTLTAMVPPSRATGGLYAPSGGTRLRGVHEAAVWQRYATVLAYCFATWGTLNTFTWHGVRRIQSDAVAIAQAAFDAGWKSTWGPPPKSRADLAPPASERSRKLVGQGSSFYGAGKAWPPHRDHMHIRLNM